MNDVNFCYKLYDDILKLYSDTSSYRITTYEDNLYKSKIEYIPVGFSEHIDNIKALGSISSYARFSLKNHLCNVNYNIDKRKQKSIAAIYLKSFFSARLNGFSARLNGIEQSIVNDYVDFSLQQGKPIDILARKKKINTLHNELAREIIRKANGRCKIIIPDTPLKYLKLPEEFTLLATQKALTDEGNINHNCVGGYGKKITSGKCVVYSADIQGEHLTIEIRCRKAKKHYKFYVSQCYKTHNQPCSEDVLAYVNSCLENCSEKAINRYLKTVTEEKRMTKSE